MSLGRDSIYVCKSVVTVLFANQLFTCCNYRYRLGDLVYMFVQYFLSKLTKVEYF